MIAFEPSEDASRFLREEEERSEGRRTRDEVINGMICHSAFHKEHHPHPVELQLREAGRKYRNSHPEDA